MAVVCTDQHRHLIFCNQTLRLVGTNIRLCCGQTKPILTVSPPLPDGAAALVSDAGDCVSALEEPDGVSSVFPQETTETMHPALNSMAVIILTALLNFIVLPPLILKLNNMLQPDSAHSLLKSLLPLTGRMSVCDDFAEHTPMFT